MKRPADWMSIPGFGPITASAMAATIQDTSSFARPAREFAAFLGLTSQAELLGAASRKLGRIVQRWAIGTCANCLSWARMPCCFTASPHTDPLRMWAKRLIEKKTLQVHVAAVALANSMARIAFAILRGKHGLSGNSGVRSVGTVRGQAHQELCAHRRRG